MEGYDEFVGFSFFQAQIRYSDCFRVIFIQAQDSFLFFEWINVITCTIMTNSIRSNNADSDIFPTAPDLWRETKLNIIIHCFGNIVNGKADVTALVNLQETWAGP